MWNCAAVVDDSGGVRLIAERAPTAGDGGAHGVAAWGGVGETMDEDVCSLADAEGHDWWVSVMMSRIIGGIDTP